MLTQTTFYLTVIFLSVLSNFGLAEKRIEFLDEVDTKDFTAPVVLVEGNGGGLYGTFNGKGDLPGDPLTAGGIFKLSPEGQFEILYRFKPLQDGITTAKKLIIDDQNNLYGVLSAIEGTFYKFTSTGKFHVLTKFPTQNCSAQGINGVIRASDGNFYGTSTSSINRNVDAVLFKITPTGEATTLHDFKSGGRLTPQGLLTESSDGYLYGVYAYTNPSTSRTHRAVVYKISLTGKLTVLHEFDWSESSKGGVGPLGHLIEGRDGRFYGVTVLGGQSRQSSTGGTIFSVNSQGDFEILHSFGVQPSMGHVPRVGLLQSRDGNFYGSTAHGGSVGNGTLYRIDTAGRFSTLHSFDESILSGTHARLYETSNGSIFGTVVSSSLQTRFFRLRETDSSFIRGDCNGDGETGEVADAVFILSANFLGGDQGQCKAACDVNGDGDITGLTDAIYLLSHNFLRGVPIPEPFTSCGQAMISTDRVLGCEEAPECANGL